MTKIAEDRAMTENQLPAPVASQIFFDTEFIEDGKIIDLVSIGMVRADGATYYAECAEADLSRASEWVKANVLVHLTGEKKSRAEIARDIIEFAGKSPEFWAYYADYDWVALCQLYGTMMDLPAGWPMFCRDIKQLCVSLGNPKLPEQSTTEHHALADALWTVEAYRALSHPAALSGGDSEPVATHRTAGETIGGGELDARGIEAAVDCWNSFIPPDRDDLKDEDAWIEYITTENVKAVVSAYLAALALPPVEPVLGVTEAAQALVDFAWSAVVTDCTESAEYLNSLVDNLRAALATAPEGTGGEHHCPICAKPFEPADLCATDIELGTCHAACLEGSPTDGPIPTFRYDEGVK